MPTVEEKIQNTVHSLEVGELAALVWRWVVILAAIGLSAWYLIHEFRGLPSAQAMDQAQIGREILRGHGWATKVARPLAIGELRAHGKDIRTATWIDTYNAPIPPLLDAIAIWLPVREGWNLTRTSPVYSGDRAIALMEVIFFLAAVLVLYHIAVELFDRRLAYLAVGLVLICDMMWRYSLSGLPQMFLLLLLHLNFYAILRALRALYLNEPHLGWMAVIGFGFGLMALTHALSIFIFVPVLIFAFRFFQPRWRGGLLMLGVFALTYAPWLVRTALVCGDFRGIAFFSAFDGIVHSEAGHMRRMSLDLGDVSGNYFLESFRLNLVGQFNRIFEYLGWSWVAPLAFVSILHPFRRPVTSMFRRLMFAMFGGAVIGMAIFGIKEDRGLAANQFYLLFVPIFICYGMAYVLVQWERRIGLGFVVPRWSYQDGVHIVLRHTLVTSIFVLSGVPLVLRMFLDKNFTRFEWPPYAPPYIAVLGEWFTPDEIIGSDMPWAVAWYADRRSLWLPFNQSDLSDLSDYQKLGGPVAALYFTPVSGTENMLGDLLNGDYQHWTTYIVRTVNLQKSPYPVRVLMGSIDCVLYMDRERRKPAK